MTSVELENEHFVAKTSQSNSAQSTPDEKYTLNVPRFLAKYVHIRNEYAKVFLAELLGTFILVSVGLGSICQNKFFSNDSPYLANGLAINIGFALAGAVAIFVVGKVSGAHINTAVSFTVFLAGQLSLPKLLVYWLGQVVGAFLAAVSVFIVYIDNLQVYPEGMYSLSTAGLFASFPNSRMSNSVAVFDACLSTMILALVVQALSDKKNEQYELSTVASIVSITLTALPCAFGYNAGGLFNPARDLGPRLFVWIAGWGNQVWSANNYFSLIPIFGPLLGSIIGTLIYCFFVSNNW